jgi:hypothetical protein
VTPGRRLSAPPDLASLDLARLRFVALAAVGSLLAHDAVFAAQYGLGPAREDALAATAHGYWPAFVALTALATLAGGGAAIRGILHLRRLARGLPGTPVPAGQPGYLAEVVHVWPRLLTVVGTTFVTQENIEHLAAGQSLPGLWVLSGPEYPLAIPVLLAVTGLLAAIGGWLRWQRGTLVRRLCAARAAATRQRASARIPHHRWALLAALLSHRWILLRRDAERAPPALVTA